MIVDGRALAKELEEQLKNKFAHQSPTRLDIILVGDDSASAQFVKLKQSFGQRVGVEVMVHEYDELVDQADLVKLLERLNSDQHCWGVIIQLPLPANLDKDALLNLISPDKDVDALGAEARVLPPVAGAVAEILTKHNIALTGKKAVVVGRGRLVGQPVAVWLTAAGAQVTVADSKTTDLANLLKTADLVVSGVGKPYFIKPEMLKEGVTLIDAGTSESSGQVVGDVDPACATKCALFTPVPGGVGPLTVAKLFENLLYLVDKGH